MTVARHHASSSIDQLPAIVSGMIEHAGATAPRRLKLRYLRRKPGRGLVAVYALPAGDPPLACLHIRESAMRGAGLQWGVETLLEAEVTGTWPEVVQIPALGLTLQAFPEDAGFPALAEVHRVHPGGPALAGVCAALRVATGDNLFTPSSVSSDPLRYKPSDRCVLRFTAQPGGETVIGKVYADPSAAASVHRRMDELYRHQLDESRAAAAARRMGPPLLPQPLVLVDTLGLTISEDVRAPKDGRADRVTEGGKLLRPQSSPASSIAAIATVATGLARLHVYPVQGEWASRTAAMEAKRVLARSEQLATHAPTHAELARAIGDRVATALVTASAAAPRAVHGSFKPAQLLFHKDRLFITDFDQLCVADPALDVGYFLAYLRPPSLWYHRRGARAWYDEHERVFLTTYAAALMDMSVDRAEAQSTTARSHLYAAALMFKIANRRPNRLNSVRAGELDAILAEIAACVGLGIAGSC
jgi:thiamine kinase-like enzyme